MVLLPSVRESLQEFGGSPFCAVVSSFQVFEMSCMFCYSKEKFSCTVKQIHVLLEPNAIFKLSFFLLFFLSCYMKVIAFGLAEDLIC